MLINHLMYADDLVLLVPSVAVLDKLLRIYVRNFGITLDVKYNSLKSAVMIFRSHHLKGVALPKFALNGETLKEVDITKYLGHLFSDDLNDDADIVV